MTSVRIITPQDSAYFDAVTRRYEQGVYVPALHFPDAQEAKCHDNADEFARRQPHNSAVRGWLVMELGGAPGYYRIVAHSVNRRADGSLIDVTPLAEADRRACRFLDHLGSEDEFNALKAKFPELYYPLLNPLG
jgi:hypothetical protein